MPAGQDLHYQARSLARQRKAGILEGCDVDEMTLDYAPHRISVDEYHRMSEAGVFQGESRIELIDGELVETRESMTPLHAWVISALHDEILTSINRRAIVRFRLPVTLGTLSEPEPDLAIVSRPRSLIANRHPGPNEIVAIVEVADTSRDFDLRRKIPIYASFGIEESWVVDLVDSCIRIFREPTPTGYRINSVAKSGERVALRAFPDVAISLGAIFS